MELFLYIWYNSYDCYDAVTIITMKLLSVATVCNSNLCFVEFIGKFIVMMILLFCILLHSVSSLNIRIDGDNGIDLNECLKEESSCQSLKYVADTVNNTGNLTIEIISPTLSLQGSVIFTDINGLTINGQGTSISCRNGSTLYGNSGIVFNNCSIVTLIGFTIEHCGFLYKEDQKYYGRQSVLFYKCRDFNISKVKFIDNNGYGLVLNDTIGGNVIQNVFTNNRVNDQHSDATNIWTLVLGKLYCAIS